MSKYDAAIDLPDGALKAIRLLQFLGLHIFDAKIQGFDGQNQHVPQAEDSLRVYS